MLGHELGRKADSTFINKVKSQWVFNASWDLQKAHRILPPRDVPDNLVGDSMYL